MSSAGIYQRRASDLAALVAGRAVDYALLAKPRIAVMAMTAVTVGYLVGLQGVLDARHFVVAELSILAVAAACNFLNQWYEIDTDRLMQRTVNRPLAGARIRPGEVLMAGVSLAVAGIAALWFYVNPLTAGLAIVTVLLYVGCYTPLKSVSSFGTVLGAVAGAMPPVLGWCASRNALDSGGLALFGLLFVWQFPHFLAIATIYRQDYESAGLKMLPVARDGRSYGASVSLVYALALIPVSLLVWRSGVAGNGFAIVSVVGGTAYLISAFRFWCDASISRAREVLTCSIVYLPTVLLTMTWDHFRLLAQGLSPEAFSIAQLISFN